jgi:hypothetical protein
MKLIDILEDLNLNQLHQNIQRGFPKTKKRQHVTHEVNANNVHFKIDTDKKLLAISADTTTSSSGNKHTPMMVLQDVMFQAPQSGQNVEVVGEDGTKQSITPVKLNVNNVLVACDCEDYIMRFAPFNVQQNCHLGNPPAPYTRKTTTYPEVNPQHLPGMCKHILKIVEILKQKRILM